jgi:hypothetical protein
MLQKSPKNVDIIVGRNVRTRRTLAGMSQESLDRKSVG